MTNLPNLNTVNSRLAEDSRLHMQWQQMLQNIVFSNSNFCCNSIALFDSVEM